MDKIYIEIFQNETEDYITVPLESALIVILYKYLKYPEKMTIKTIEIQNYPKFSSKILKIKSEFLNFLKKSDKNILNYNLKPPYYVHDENHFISGFTAVAREMIINSELEEFEYLLGFNRSCLQAPTECSSWTKFCEINIINAFQEIIQHFFVPSMHIFEIPKVFGQFDNHLKKPLKINDKYRKIIIKSKKIITKEDVKFAEYDHPTLVDLLIYISFKLSFEFLPEIINLKLLKNFVFLSKWLNDVQNYDNNLDHIWKNTQFLLFKEKKQSNYEQIYWLSKNNSFEIFNKYNQCEKYKPINKITTVHSNIANSIKKLKGENLNISSETKFKYNYNLEWNAIPDEFLPQHGGVPNSRLERKKVQLKNLIDVVMTLINDGETIIDFCSGSGHLGIILATLLPNCTIIFLEMKQFSLLTTKERAKKLQLKNCLFYQSNIDYFIGKFNIGISLHACGTATDIVLRKCIQERAKFISCPCCYGSINPMPHITYPLSKIYKRHISENDYLYIAHAADLNSNVEDNINCMDVIDTDRKLFTEEMGYNCLLSRLSPENCTPKNRILIGTIK